VFGGGDLSQLELSRTGETVRRRRRRHSRETRFVRDRRVCGHFKLRLQTSYAIEQLVAFGLQLVQLRGRRARQNRPGSGAKRLLPETRRPRPHPPCRLMDLEAFHTFNLGLGFDIPVGYSPSNQQRLFPGTLSRVYGAFVEAQCLIRGNFRMRSKAGQYNSPPESSPDIGCGGCDYGDSSQAGAPSRPERRSKPDPAWQGGLVEADYHANFLLVAVT